METRSSKRIKEENSKQDFEDGISNLPDDILHQILSLLPIKSIAQTSIISKRWRHLWNSIPDLDFTTITPLATTAFKGGNNHRKRFVAVPTSNDANFLSDVLALRADVRVVRLKAHLTFTNLNRLIRLALMKNVQELDIQVSTNDYFNLPRMLLRSSSLTVFRFKSFFPGFRLPPPSAMTAGFRFLRSMSLSSVNLLDQPKLVDLFTDTSFPLLIRLNLETCFGLKCLKVGCLGLEELVLENCFQLRQLEVQAPKLKSVHVVSCFNAYGREGSFKIVAPNIRVMIWRYNAYIDKYDMENLSSLEEASVEFNVFDKYVHVNKLRGVGNLMVRLSHANNLTLGNHCLQILLSSKIQLGTAVAYEPFTALKSLELHMGLDTRSNVTGLARLFKRSPSLHTLIINTTTNDKTHMKQQWNSESWETDGIEGEEFWESQSEALDLFLGSLNVVKMKGFLGYEEDISLVTFLLRHGRALQEMILCCTKRNNNDYLRRRKIRSQMMAFSWASSNAKISFR